MIPLGGWNKRKQAFNRQIPCRDDQVTEQHGKTNGQILRQLRREIRAAREKQETRTVCRLLGRYGSALLVAELEAEGMQAFEQASLLANSLQDAGLLAECLQQKLSACQEAQRWQTGLQTAEDLLTLADRSNNRGWQCAALVGQAEILLQQNQVTQALHPITQAGEIAGQLNDRRALMRIYGLFAGYHWRSHSPSQTRVFLRQAIDLAVELNDPRAELDYLEDLRKLLQFSTFGEAEATLPRMIRLAQAVGDHEAQERLRRHLIDLYFWHGNDLLARGEAASALGTYRKGSDLHDEQDRSDIIFFLYRQAGKALVMLGAVEEAIAAYHSAIALTEGDPWPINAAISRGLLAQAYSAYGDIKAAEEFSRQALEFFDTLEAEDIEAYQIADDIQQARQLLRDIRLKQ